MKKIAQNAGVWVVTAAMLVVVLAIGFFKLGPKIEPLMKQPLFSEVMVLPIISTDAYMDVMVSATKSRDCFIQAANVEVKRNGEWIRGDVKMLKVNGTDLTIPEQRVSNGGKFIRQLRIQPSGESIRVTVDSACHPFWTTSQLLVEIDIKKH